MDLEIADGQGMPGGALKRAQDGVYRPVADRGFAGFEALLVA